MKNSVENGTMQCSEITMVEIRIWVRIYTEAGEPILPSELALSSLTSYLAGMELMQKGQNQSRFKARVTAF
jgi:hypothetical protein